MRVTMGLVLWGGLALAEETPFPQALDVLVLDADSPCPDVDQAHVPSVIRTNVGAAFHQGDGTYAYGCPAAWDGDGEALLAASPDGGEIYAVTRDGRAFRSANGGCSATMIALPEGQIAVDVAWWRNQPYFLTATAGDELGGAVLYFTGEGLTELISWDDGFEPSRMLPAGGDVLWVTSIRRTDGGGAGVRNGARIRRLTLAGGLGGFDADVEPLPEDIFDITAFEPRAADADEAWFVLTKGNTQWTWHAQVVEGSVNTVPILTDTYAGKPKPRVVAGPVKFDGLWVAAIDNQLHRSAQRSRLWVAEDSEVPWTCLRQTGERVFACTPRALLAVTEIVEGGIVTTSEVFTFAQLGPAVAGCGDPSCDTRYAELRQRAEVDPEVVASCPDGRTLADLSATECTCATGFGPGAWGLGAAMMGLAARRRQRQSAPPRNT